MAMCCGRDYRSRSYSMWRGLKVTPPFPGRSFRTSQHPDVPIHGACHSGRACADVTLAIPTENDNYIPIEGPAPSARKVVGATSSGVSRDCRSSIKAALSSYWPQEVDRLTEVGLRTGVTTIRVAATSY